MFLKQFIFTKQMLSSTLNVVPRRRSSLRIGSARIQLLPLIFLLIGGDSLRRLAAADTDQPTTHDGDEAAGTEGELAELGIEIVEKPSNCERTSQNGNMLKVHYTGYFSNGTQFDTRCGIDCVIDSVGHICSD
jgi:hypothetical protein